MRALEAEARREEPFAPGERVTDIFLKPGSGPRFCDGLVTNFHLPRSTLLALVASMAGHELMVRAYAEAIEQRYRFYSYGDAMFIDGRHEEERG
jgi:S-adenosylmethionine:tRNA ribosyltransferase-isomerase